MGEFLSDVASAGELGFGKTLSLVFLMMCARLGIVVSGVGAGGDVESGDMSWPGTTIRIAGVVVTINNIIRWFGGIIVRVYTSRSLLGSYIHQKLL